MEVQEANVHIGDGVVVVRRKGSSSPAIAKILGSDEQGGRTRIYLDRLVHKHYENELGAYGVSGAISTILIMPEGAAAAQPTA
jgi:hypothetical protein